MELVPPNIKRVTKHIGPNQGPNVGKVFNKQFLSLKKYRFVLREKMSSLGPWVELLQSFFDLYLRLDWLALGGTIVFSYFLLFSGTSSILRAFLGGNS